MCTAGNSSTENDGAAAVIVASEKKTKELGIEPFASVKSCAVAGDDPRYSYRTVPGAVKKALDSVGLGIKNMDLVEIQEAFAARF